MSRGRGFQVVLTRYISQILTARIIDTRIQMRAHTHTYAYAYTYNYIYSIIRIYVYICTLHLRISTHECTSTYTSTVTSIYTHIYICLYIHNYIHILLVGRLAHFGKHREVLLSMARDIVRKSKASAAVCAARFQGLTSGFLVVGSQPKP